MPPRYPAWISYEDIRQVIALAQLEGTDPSKAITAFIESERRYYGMILYYFGSEETDPDSPLIRSTAPLMVRLTTKTPRPPGGWPSDHKPRQKPNRSPESMEQRRAYCVAYRKKRKLQTPPTT